MFEHIIAKTCTSMYQDSFNVPDLFWYTEHPYFLLQIKDKDAVTVTLNIFLVTYPGVPSFLGPWAGLKAFLAGPFLNYSVLGVANPTP